MEWFHQKRTKPFWVMSEISFPPGMVRTLPVISLKLLTNQEGHSNCCTSSALPDDMGRNSSWWFNLFFLSECKTEKHFMGQLIVHFRWIDSMLSCYIKIIPKLKYDEWIHFHVLEPLTGANQMGIQLTCKYFLRHDSAHKYHCLLGTINYNTSDFY